MVKKFLIILVFCISGYPAISNIDSLIQVTQAQKDTNAVLAGYELGKALVSRDIDSSYMFLIAAANLADRLDYTHGKIVTYRSIGSVAPRMGKYEESLTWLNKGMRLIDSLNLPIKNKVDFLTNIGVAHYRVGLLGKAIETYIEAVDICRENGFDEQRSRLLNNLGIFYRSLERYDEAIGIYEQSYELRFKVNDTLGMANVKYNMATAYSKISDHESAIMMLDAAEKLYILKNQKKDAIHCFIAKGIAYQNLHDTDNAYLEFKKAHSFPYEKLEVPFNYNLYIGLASVSMERKELAKAEQYLDKVANDVINSDFSEQKINFYEAKSLLHKRKGQYKAAFESLNALIDIKTEITESEKASFRQEMETKYLSSEKQYEIELLNTKNELTETKLKVARIRNVSLGIGLLVFAGLILWLYQLYQTTKKQKEKISIANKEKDILLKEIHHRVKNNLQVISSLLSLQSRYVKDENAVSALSEGQNRVQSMALIHQNLYREDNLSGVDMKMYIPLLANNIFDSYNLDREHIKIEFDIDAMTLDESTVIPIGLVLNELISNALKYAFKDRDNGLLKITLNDKNSSLFLKVEDNGIGIEKGVSTGFGTKLIKSFIRKLDGELKVRTENGTVIEIIIKNYQAA